MYCRMTLVRLKRGLSQDAQVIFQRSIMPAARAQKGFRGIYWLQSVENPSECIGLSFWDSREDAEENERSGYYSEQRDKISQLVIPETVRKGYEVLAMAERPAG